MEGLVQNGGIGVLDFFLRLYFGSTAIWPVLSGTLWMVGLWKIFEKSGVKGW